MCLVYREGGEAAYLPLAATSTLTQMLPGMNLRKTPESLLILRVAGYHFQYTSLVIFPVIFRFRLAGGLGCVSLMGLEYPIEER